MIAIFKTYDEGQRLIDLINQGAYIGMNPLPLVDGSFAVPILSQYEDYFTGTSAITNKLFQALLIPSPYKILNYADYGTVVYSLFSEINAEIENGKLVKWTDSTSGIMFCDQPDSVKRPVYDFGKLNGFPTIKFNIPDLTYLTFDEKIAKPLNWTIFILCRIPDNTIRQAFCGASDVPGNGTKAWGGIFNKDIGVEGRIEVPGSITSVNSDDVHASCSTTDPNETIKNNEWIIITVSYQDGDAFQRIYANGLIQEIQTAPTECNTNSGQTREFTIGRPGGYSGIYSEMEMEATVLFISKVKDADILTIANNWKQKYKI